MYTTGCRVKWVNVDNTVNRWVNSTVLLVQGHARSLKLVSRRQTDVQASWSGTIPCTTRCYHAAQHYLPRRLRGVVGNQQLVHCYRLVVDSNWSHSSINLRDILTKTSEIQISPTPVSFNPAALSDPVTTVTSRSQRTRARGLPEDEISVISSSSSDPAARSYYVPVCQCLAQQAKPPQNCMYAIGL